MNRPRNRQPRAPRQQHGTNAGAQSGPGRHSTVPTVQQVVPGASVSIVLKADQSTGRETPGVVKDLLTQGNHPRGIKVRLHDGQVGRVQRMMAPVTSTQAQSGTNHIAVSSVAHSVQRDETERLPALPPTRTLADFIPDVNEHQATDGAVPTPDIIFASASIKCPICEHFEGDEVAVSHHVESHLT